LVPAVINNIKTKKLSPILPEIEQLQYIFEVYAGETVSLRRLQDILIAEERMPLNGSAWTTAKLSGILKNPIYVRADSDVYEYFERHGVQMITDMGMFTGEYGAQLYGRTKHDPDSGDWSDMKLVLLTHSGIVDSDIWLKCQRKLEKNKQVGNSVSNRTSWLSGMLVCEMCGHTMTTVKGKINRDGEQQRYFNCTGKSHKKICTGPKVSIYAGDLENMVYNCISEKLSEIKNAGHTGQHDNAVQINDLKLKIKELERYESQLVESMLSGGFNSDLLSLANQKATQLKREKMVLYDRIEEQKNKSSEVAAAADLARSWRKADYTRKKEVARIMISKIIISEAGDTKIIWNI
jgi:hypothetical protein